MGDLLVDRKGGTSRAFTSHPPLWLFIPPMLLYVKTHPRVCGQDYLKTALGRQSDSHSTPPISMFALMPFTLHTIISWKLSNSSAWFTKPRETRHIFTGRTNKKHLLYDPLQPEDPLVMSPILQSHKPITNLPLLGSKFPFRVHSY